jgi:hypothetical protein
MEINTAPEIDLSVQSLESAVEESREWLDDFGQEYEDHHPDIKIDIDIVPEDVDKLNQLVRFFSKATDEEIKQRLSDLKEDAPPFMNDLKGVTQHSPHQGIDAFDHTFNTFYYLNTEGMTSQERLIARMTMLLHDIAKIEGDGQNHPRASGSMVNKILTGVEIDDTTKSEIERQVTYHDFLGDIARRDDYGFFRPQQMVEFFDDESQVRLHRAVVLADVASIPGLRTYLPNIEKVYGRLIGSLDRLNWKFNPSEDSGEVLDDEAVFAIVDRIIPYREFDDTDINEDCEQRRIRFSELSEPEKLLLEKYILQASQDHDDNYLKVLQATGRETDESYVDELENKYRTKSPELRLACNIFRATYGMWEVNRLIRDLPNWESEIKYIEFWLGEIRDAGDRLSKMETSATHCTTYEAKPLIERSGKLLKSVGEGHFEGDGVYVGLMNSYSDWAEYMYRFNIKMEDLLPIIVSFNYPKIMANVLCDHLDIHAGEKEFAIPKGNIEWLHRGFENHPSPTQIHLLEKYLGKVTPFEDIEGFNCFMVTTEHPPIIWGMIARALRIRNVIPEYELMYYSYEEYDEDQDEKLPKNTSIRLKGITMRELAEEM